MSRVDLGEKSGDGGNPMTIPLRREPSPYRCHNCPHILTPRQRQILSLVADGLQDKEVGSRLGISRLTVRHTLETIRGKLNADNTVQAVAVAIRRGLIE